MKKIKFFVCLCTLVASICFGNAEVKAASGSFSFSGGEIIEEDSVSSESAIQTADVVVPSSSTSVSSGNSSTGFSGGMSLSGGTIEEEEIAPSKEDTTKDDIKPSQDTSKEETTKDDTKPSQDTSKEETTKDDTKPSQNVPSKDETTKDDTKPSQDTSKETIVADKTENASNDTSTVESSNETETPSVSTEEQTQFQAENQPVAVASNDSTTVAPNSMNKGARKSAVSGEAKSSGSLLKLLPPMSGDYGLVPSAEAEGKTEFPVAPIGLLSLLLLLLLGLLSIRYKVVDADDNNSDHFMTLKKAVCNANGNEGYKVLDNFKKASEKCVLEIKDQQAVIPEYVSDNNRKRIMEYVQN